jgi:hypothetical protein
MAAVSGKMRALLQEFVEARVDVPELFARAEKLLPKGSDAGEEILELLAEAELRLTLPATRKPFVHRLEQFASGESSFTELALWSFSLGQTELLAPDAPTSPNPEVNLLRTMVDWIDQWDDETVRPTAAQVQELAGILEREADPVRCLEQLEQALERFDRN